MPLRCLLFSTNDETVPPIWRVLADLGIEGEHCRSAVDAVERVTTQLFQIVITDWDDQPEAAFLLKTARDLKASQRPLTLAIVGDDARLPEALKAGANSVLVKPIREEQVRDTMSTACELLRARQQPATAHAAAPAPPATAMAATASAGAVSAPLSAPLSAPPSVPASVTQAPEKTFRSGEFLQTATSKPGAQFDTESEVAQSIEQAGAPEMEALTELEPMAAAVQEAPVEPEAPLPEPQEPLTGWASLQARLTKTAPPPAEEAPAKSELLAYGETPSYGAASSPVKEGNESAKNESQPESGSEAALFAYLEGHAAESSEPAVEPRSKRSRILLAAILVACVVLVAVPRTRRGLRFAYQSAVHAGASWLNPPPTPVPQTAPQHDSFGQAGDEYKLPVAGNIPDATTDPSQIRVLPVVDPTAKPAKGSETNTGQEAGAPGDNSGNPSQSGQNSAGQVPTGQNESGQGQAGEVPARDPTTSGVSMPRDTGAATGGAPAAMQTGPAVPVPQAVAAAPHPVNPPVRVPAPPRTVSAGSSTGIPSSLKSQLAAPTPDPGGNKSPETALSSIEPVTLPEAAARGLLTQATDPEYPAAVKASGQRGSVVLQVLIGRDGTVQDAKFLQGSLIFARAAVDAVKQWRFKPYSMNGRAVTVQSVITLNFKPPA